jgi:hypothetical protein
MRAARLLLGLVAGTAAVAGTPGAGLAEDAVGSGYAIDARTTAGYRSVDVDGSKAKYREDYNLRSGLRLFDLDLDGVAKAPDATRLDRFHLEVDTPGDEPVSHFRLSAADRTLYDFRADFTRSKYYYAVPQLFTQPVAGDVKLDDLHDWNLVRTNGAVDLTVHAPHLPTLLFGYRLYETHGSAVTTVRIPAGDTFLVDAPVDTVTNVGRLGTEFRALDTDFFLQQEYRRVDRRHDLGPVRSPLGVDPTDVSTLTAFQSEQDEHLDIPATTVRVRRQLGDAAEVTGAYYYSHADLSFGLARRRVGTSDVPTLGGTETRNGGGGAAMDTHVADAGTDVRLAEHVHLHATYRLNDQSESGSFAQTGSAGPLALDTGDHVRVHSVTGELELEPRSDLSLRAGVRYGRRDARFSLSSQSIATDTVGAVGGVRYRPWSFLDLHARYESLQVDDPFVVPGDARAAPPLPRREIAYTFTNRGTAGLRIEPAEWVAVSYQLVADSAQNGSFHARAQNFGNSVALTVTPREGLSFFASYTRRDLDSAANILFAPLYQRALSLQSGSEDVFVSELRWDFALARQRWSTGWDVSYVSAGNTLRPNLEPGLAGRKFFDLDRIDGGAFLTLHHAWLEPSLEFRMIDYAERVLPGNDYRATLVTVKVTKRWSF